MMKRKKTVGKHKWTRTDGLLGATAVVGGIIIGFMLNKQPLPLEGDYTRWTKVAEIEEPLVGYNGLFNLWLTRDKKIIYAEMVTGGFSPKKIDVNTWTITGASTPVYNAMSNISSPGDPMYRSIQGTYYVGIVGFAPNNDLVVYKNGEAIQTILGADSGLASATWLDAVFSWDGQYILVGARFAAGVSKYFIFKGS